MSCGRRALWLGLTFWCSACSGDPAVEATTVLNHRQCGSLPVGVSRVEFDEVARLRGSHLIRMPDPDAAPEADADPSAGAPATAADAPLLVAVSRGEQPTPGYGFTLEGVHRSDTTAVVTVGWETPAADAALAQVMTHPCLVVALPRADFRRVEVVDGAGDVLGGLDL